MSDDYGTIPMFEVPERYRSPDRQPDRGVAWKVYKGPRTSCFDCIMDIARGDRQVLGWKSSWTRTEDGDIKHFCSSHAQTRIVKEKR